MSQKKRCFAKKLAYLLIPVAPVLSVAAPIAPTDLTLTPTDTTVEISWKDRAENETGYKIFRDGELLALLPRNTTHYVDRSLKKNHTYHYTVKADDEVTTWATSSKEVRQDERDLSIEGAKHVQVHATLDDHAHLYLYDRDGAVVGDFSGAGDKSLTVKGEGVTARVVYDDNADEENRVTVSIAPSNEHGVVHTWNSGFYENHHVWSAEHRLGYPSALGLVVTVIGETGDANNHLYIGSMANEWHGDIHETVLVNAPYTSVNFQADDSVTGDGVSVTVAPLHEYTSWRYDKNNYHDKAGFRFLGSADAENVGRLFIDDAQQLEVTVDADVEYGDVVIKDENHREIKRYRADEHHTQVHDTFKTDGRLIYVETQPEENQTGVSFGAGSGYSHSVTVSNLSVDISKSK